MNKYVIYFREGVAITAEADSKSQAIEKVRNEYSRLFESQDFQVITIFSEITASGEILMF
jgi:hypothetical protein